MDEHPKKNMSYLDQLRNLLDDVEPLGTFATSGVMKSLPFPEPNIVVDGVGRLSFPLMDIAVEPLKAVAAKAPFGKGTETMLDDAVRQAWQIDATKVTIALGSHWEAHLNEVVRKACKELGISDQRLGDNGVRVHLYKLLLYEKGGHFLPHRDTEKEDGMFGTLIIQLPSEFTGGEVTVNHGGETKNFPLSNGCINHFRYLAFYADCYHQVHPVESGFRVCLAYNLVSLPDKIAPTHALNIETETKLRLLVSEWKDDSGGIPKLGYQLGHQYTPPIFSLSSLKGRDDVVCQTLTCAKSATGAPLLTVHLLLMERRIEECLNERHSYDIVRAIKVVDSSGNGIDHKKWEMYKRKDGWLIPKNVFLNLFKCKEDDDEAKLLFEGVSPAVDEEINYLGNEGDQLYVYYAASIVMSPV